MTYQEYLKSEHWKLLRGAKLQTSPRCERCAAKTELEVHHRIYRQSWFDARVQDLQTLCHHCHTTHHATGGDHGKMEQLRRLEAAAKPNLLSGRAQPTRPVVIRAPATIAAQKRITALQRMISRAERKGITGGKWIEKKRRRLSKLLAT